MATDIKKSLTQIITEFRALQSKDAVTPDSLGYILQRIVNSLSEGGSSNPAGSKPLAQIAVFAENGVLQIQGAKQLIADGYVPYLFRLTRKRNKWDDKYSSKPTPKKYCAPRKGWNLFGSCHTIAIGLDNSVLFSTNNHTLLSKPAEGYSTAPTMLVSSHIRDDGTPAFGWGRACVSLLDYKSNTKAHRMIRLRFAIGFGKMIPPSRARITTANLVSSLAEFSLIYEPTRKVWHFGK